jgi:hypothetical protein
MNDLFWYSRKLREAVSTTGMENGWSDEKCKEVFDQLMDKYLNGTLNDEVDISGSYNGSTPGSEPVNEGPTPSPEATEIGYSTGKWSDDDDMGITPFLGPNR